MAVNCLHTLPATTRRMVGTRNDFGNTDLVSNGTNNSFNFRVYKYAVAPIVDPSVVYAGWTRGTGTETDYPNSVTYHTSIELPDGSVHELLKSGSASHVVASGDIFNESDRLTGFTIPIGGYWLCGHGSVANGALYYASSYPMNTVFTDGWEEGVGLTDKTLVPGTIGQTAAKMVMPVGLMGTVPQGRRSFCIMGDSISVGQGGVYNPLTGGAIGVGYGGGVGYMAGYLDGKFDYVHMGHGGDGATGDVLSVITRRIKFTNLANLTDLWDELGVNDLGGQNKSAVVTQLAIANMFTNWMTIAFSVNRMWQSTITPDTTLSPATPPTSDVNQTTQANFVDGRRLTLNTTIRALGITGQTGFVEVALGVQNALNNNWWIAGYSDDGLHPNQAGNVAIIAYLNANFGGF